MMSMNFSTFIVKFMTLGPGVQGIGLGQNDDIVKISVLSQELEII